MSEAQSSGTKSKMIDRNVAVALGIICIVLVASLTGTLLVLNGANQQNTNLQSQLTDLSDISNLKNSEVIVDRTVSIFPDNDSWHMGYFNANYSGCIGVDVEPPKPNLWVLVTWSHMGTSNGTLVDLSYREIRFQGSNDSAEWKYYPIISSLSEPTSVFLYIYNNSTTETITANVTITYYY